MNEDAFLISCPYPQSLPKDGALSERCIKQLGSAYANPGGYLVFWDRAYPYWSDRILSEKEMVVFKNLATLCKKGKCHLPKWWLKWLVLPFIFGKWYGSGSYRIKIKRFRGATYVVDERA